MPEPIICEHPDCVNTASISTTSQTFYYPRCKEHIQEWSQAYYDNYGKPAPQSE